MRMNHLLYLFVGSFLIQVAWSCSGDSGSTKNGDDEKGSGSGDGDGGGGGGGEEDDDHPTTKDRNRKFEYATKESGPTEPDITRNKDELNLIVVIQVIDGDHRTKEEGAPLQGAKVNITKPVKVQKETDADGKAVLGKFAKGEVIEGKVSHTNYYTRDFHYTVQIGQNQIALTPISKTLDENSYRIIMSWPDMPHDMDLHAAEVWANNGTRTGCDLSFRNKGEPVPFLCPGKTEGQKSQTAVHYVVDNVNQGMYGPETIIWSKKQPEYYYLIYVVSYLNDHAARSHAQVFLSDGKSGGDAEKSYDYDRDCTDPSCAHGTEPLKMWIVGCLDGGKGIESFKPINKGLVQGGDVLEKQEYFEYCKFS